MIISDPHELGVFLFALETSGLVAFLSEKMVPLV